MLFQPEILGNTGAAGRSCVALEAKLWLVRPLGFRLDEKALRRAGLDYWPNLNWEVAKDWESLQESLGARRFWFFTKHAIESFWEAEFSHGDVLVFGSETAGLPEGMLSEHSESQLKIPISDGVRSLNLASSVAVAGYEVARKIGLASG